MQGSDLRSVAMRSLAFLQATSARTATALKAVAGSPKCSTKACGDATSALHALSHNRRRPFMSFLHLGLVTLSLLVASSGAVADVGRATAPPVSVPTSQERLPQPVQLGCIGMRVIEWRASKALPATTAFSTQGIQEMSRLCEIAIRRYPEFMRSKGLQFAPAPLDVDISLLPANTIMDGKDPRNLNDTAGRFRVVQPTCCSWGIWDTPTHSLFLRNDPIYFSKTGASANKYFGRTMSHEMMHVLNSFYNARALNGFDEARDEQLAEDFVGYLGFDFKTESSAQDFAIKFPPQMGSISVKPDHT
jgi:hypothetical protein